MKMTTIPLPTASLLCVPVPNNWYDFGFLSTTVLFYKITGGGTGSKELPLNWHDTPEILGICSPPDGIDFDSSVVNLTKSEMIFILNAELSKVYPHKVNPYGEHEPADDYPRGDAAVFEHDTVLEMKNKRRQWHAAEKLVLPSRLLIILNK